MVSLGIEMALKYLNRKKAKADEWQIYDSFLISHS